MRLGLAPNPPLDDSPRQTTCRRSDVRGSVSQAEVSSVARPHYQLALRLTVLTLHMLEANCPQHQSPVCPTPLEDCGRHRPEFLGFVDVGLLVVPVVWIVS